MLDVIIRFHDPRRLLELKRCVFSLVCASYRPLNVIIVTQRFSDFEIEAINTAIDPMLRIEGAPSLRIVNWTLARPLDGRSALINEGIRYATGRYLAFLDYDDVIYPSGYELLINRLETEHCGIAFASVRTLIANVHQSFIEATGVREPFPGRTLLDLFKNNFCPIHSYVLDRQAAPAGTISFDESLRWEEDYEFLLRICARVRSSFSLMGVFIGDYYKKTDGSNTIATDERTMQSQKADYAQICAAMLTRKRVIRLSLEVRRSLGIPDSLGNFTIADLFGRDGEFDYAKSKCKADV